MATDKRFGEPDERKAVEGFRKLTGVQQADAAVRVAVQHETVETAILHAFEIAKKNDALDGKQFDHAGRPKYVIPKMWPDPVIHLLQTGRFNMLVSDIGMPGEDGYALTRRVRSLGKDRGGDIAAIAWTAYARAEDRVRAVTAGFIRHVVKPVEPVEFVTMVAGAAGGSGQG